MARRTVEHRSITAAGLARLLARLDPDHERAAQEYERLRRALIRFFDWRGAWSPEECADEAIDRLARKLEETNVEDVRNYAYGIARLVLLERQRGPVFAPFDAESDERTHATAPSDQQDDTRRDCFDRCLSEVPDEGRALVLRYYEGDRQTTMSTRRTLAAALGLSDNALRSRVQRLRDRLERCVRECVSQTPE
jgi:DNA-directed RNA polymerase specialized sigma24 family protein